MDDHDTHSNQTNSDSHDQHASDRGPTQGSGEEGSSANAFMLIFLVLLALVIIGVILFYNPGSQQQPAQPDTATTTANEADPSNGYTIPTRQVQTTEVSGQSGLPEGLPIPETAQVVRNYSAQFGETGTQRVFSYDTQAEIREVSKNFQTWLTDADYKVGSINKQGDGNLITATQANNDMNVSMAPINGDVRVQINFISK